MPNTFQSLFKKRLRLLPTHKLFFIFLGVGLVLFTIINGVLVWAVNSVNNNEVTNIERINHLILVNTIVVALFATLITIWLFRVEVDERLIKLDQHYGYEPRNIFLVRLIESVFWLATFLISIVIINLIFISAAKGYENSYYYKAYLTSLGWYALGAIAFTGLTIFITSFLKVIWSLIIIMVLLIGLLATTNFGGSIIYDKTTVVKVDSKKEPDSLVVRDRNNYDTMHTETRISKIYTFLEEDYQDVINPWLEFELEVNRFVSFVEQSPYSLYAPWFHSAGGTKLINLIVTENPGLAGPSLLTDENNQAIVKYYNFFDTFFEQYSNDFRDFYLADSGINKGGNVKSKMVIRLLKKMQRYDLGNYQKLVDFFEKQYEDSAVDAIVRNLPQFTYFNNFEFLPKKLQDGTINFAQFLFQAVLSNSFDEVLNKVTNDTGGAWGSRSYEQEFVKYLQFNKFASRVAKSAIYNPFTQLSLMFNGVSYQNPVGYEQAMAGLSPPVFAANKYAYAPDGWKDITVHRVVKVEAIYISYLVFFGLLIFASYWIFRSKIK